MKVLIYEPESAGHRFHYVSLLVSAFSELGADVVLATTADALSSDPYEVHLSLLSSRIEPLQVPSIRDSRIARTRQESARMLAAFNASDADHVVIPTASHFINALAWSRKKLKLVVRDQVTMEGVFFSHGFGYQLPTIRQRMSSFYQAMIESRLPFETMDYIDMLQLEAMKNKYGNHRNFRLIPDPAPLVNGISQSAARKELNLPSDGWLFGCTGEMGVDKGIPDVLAAFATALPKLPSDARLLLAGIMRPAISTLVQQKYGQLLKQGRLLCLNRLLTSREMEVVFPALDLVCAAQIGRPGPSGTIVRAATSGVPVLARDLYWSRTMVNAFDLGWTCPTWHHEKFAAAIVECVELSQNYQRSARAIQFAKFHDEKNYQATMTSLIRQRLGLPPDPNKIEWSWCKEIGFKQTSTSKTTC